MATIWDADVLIWSASQIVNARDAGLRTSRLMAATPIRDLDLRRPGRKRRGLSAPQSRPSSAPSSSPASCSTAAPPARSSPRATTELLVDHDPPALASRIG